MYNFIPNTMVSNISVMLNELSLIENLTDSLQQYIKEKHNDFSIFAFGRAGNYFAVDEGYFIPKDPDKLYFENLKDCVLYIIKENKNLIFMTDKYDIKGERKNVYIPGVYFKNSIDTITYLENLTLNDSNLNPKFYDINRKEMLFLNEN